MMKDRKMTIDIFTHIMPAKYVAALEKMSATGKIPTLKPGALDEARVPGMMDIEVRLKLRDNYPDIKEVLSLTGPFLETVAGPEVSPELARIANDEVAEIVARYPERFITGTATLPLNNLEATLQEIDRAVKVLKLRGIQIGTDVNGKPLDLPEFMPIYEKMEKYSLPIFIHPSKNQLFPDYPGESESKYGLFGSIGWPHSTSMAMLRLAHSGVLEKYPKLKFVTHHAGGTIPFLAKRAEGSDKHALPKTVGEYLRRFYNDTAVGGNTSNLMCAYAFFGDRHLAFGTDFPFGAGRTKVVLQSIEEMTIAEAEKKNILENNARKILGLS
jgi:predicted TIM-barrel fold metal-dependent hydrolase